MTMGGHQGCSAGLMGWAGRAGSPEMAGLAGGRDHTRKIFTAVLVAARLALSSPMTAGAQGTGSLDQVQSLMSEGRIMEAREVLETWLDSRLASASREDRQRGVWLRGKLTVDPSMAEMDFRRLVLEYPGGAYSADALFRLGLLAELRGDRAEALALLERLIRDYPSSPLQEDAETWHGTLSQGAALPARLSSPGVEPPIQDADLIPPATPAPTDSMDASWSYAVQLGAFNSLERARALADRLRHAGYDPRVVGIPEDELARVRVGRFPVREEAEVLAEELAGHGFEVRVVSDAWCEERVRSGEVGLTKDP